MIDREKRDSPTGGFGGRTVTPLVETMLRIRVKFGDRDTEIKGVGQAYWSRAAKDAAERLGRWILRARDGQAVRVDQNLEPRTLNLNLQAEP